MTRAPTGAQALVEALGDVGIELVFGLAGTTTMDVIDALDDAPDIRYLSVRHEQAASHMADGHWRASGRLAACLVSRGPGAANLAIGVHNAHAESVPLLVLVGQVPDALAHREAFEELDLVSFFRPMTKWAIEIHDPDRVRELVGRAARTAVVGRPRPVMVSIPLDVLQAASLQERPRSVVPSVHHPRPAIDDLGEVADLLRSAAAPTIVLGGGMLRREWSVDVVALARTLAAPVVTTWMRKNAYPNDDRCFVGTLGYGAHASAEEAVRDADVLVALGCRFSEFTTRRHSLVREDTTVVQVDVDAEAIATTHRRTIGLVGDAWQVAATLSDAMEGARPTPTRTDRVEGLRADYLAETASATERQIDTGGVPSSMLVGALARTMQRHDPILVQDTHSFGPWISRYLPLHRPGTHYGAAGGAMGWGLPAALGVQLARPDERVLAVCGDGSFWMVAQELETAVREQLPIVVVVTNNFSYGNTRDRQRLAHGARYSGVFHGNPDFAALARLLGGHGERVEIGDELDGALDRAFAAGTLAVVDVIQDPMEGLPNDLVPPSARSG